MHAANLTLRCHLFSMWNWGISEIPIIMIYAIAFFYVTRQSDGMIGMLTKCVRTRTFTYKISPPPQKKNNKHHQHMFRFLLYDSYILYHSWKRIVIIEKQQIVQDKSILLFAHLECIRLENTSQIKPDITSTVKDLAKV